MDTTLEVVELQKPTKYKISTVYIVFEGGKPKKKRMLQMKVLMHLGWQGKSGSDLPQPPHHMHQQVREEEDLRK